MTNTTKTHYATSNVATSVCGRGKRLVTGALVSQVTCLNCKDTPEYQEARAAAEAARRAAFDAQTPTTVREPWGQRGEMVCSECGHNLFRYQGRSCYGHYEDHVCANCGHVESRLTETGMCF